MSAAWQYYGPNGQPTREPLFPELFIIETVGPRELELVFRARNAASGILVVEHTRKGNARRLAARRLVERELLAGPNAYGGQRTGWLYAYTLTVRGRECWLRTKVQGR